MAIHMSNTHVYTHFYTQVYILPTHMSRYMSTHMSIGIPFDRLAHDGKVPHGDAAVARCTKKE